MGSISIEEPPASTDRQLAEYLARMMTLINIELNSNNHIRRTTIVPPHPRVATIYYFSAAIAGDPNITAEGLYVFKSTGWSFIA